MNARTLALPPTVVQWRARARQAWRARAPRERAALTVMALLVGALLGWLIFIQPAWRTLRDTPAQIDALDAQLQQMQRLAAESQSLRGVAAVTPAQASAALKAATERLGDKGRLSLQGDRASLTLANASPEALRAWLLEARSAARVRPIEAQLTRGAQGFSGTLVVLVGQGGGS